MLISFVIPCYRSEKTIGKVVEEIKTTVLNEKGYDYEIVLVNDSSPDGLINVLFELGKSDKKIKVVDFAKNFGQHSALMAGYTFTTGEIVVSLDDDGQTPANEVFKLINTLNKKIDVAFARYSKKRHSWFRNFGSRINDYMAELLIGKPKDLFLSSYFVAKRYVIDEMLRYNNSYPYIGGLILRATNKIGNADITHRDRTEGKSNYTLFKLLGLWTNGFTAFSVKPLRISSFVGCIFAVIGFIIATYSIIHKIMNPQTAIGWSSMMGFTSLIAGVTLIILGMIGEYIGRIYISINNSPQYVIRNTLNIDKK